MLIAHFADTHLGKKLYGIQQTMIQFMNHFQQAVELALKEHVDAFVFAGDFFDESHPPNIVLRKAIDVIDKMTEKSSKVYIVTGDHDRVKRSDLSPIHVLTKARVPWSENYFIDKTVKDGVEYHIVGINNFNLRASERLRAELSKQLRVLSQRAGRNSIIILHQNILNLFPIERYGLTFDDIPQTPKYIAMGHLHRRIVHKRTGEKGVQVIAYPGSIDIFSRDELEEAKTQGKGFYIVDISRDEPIVHKINVETTPFEYVESGTHESELVANLTHALSSLSGLVREDNKGIIYLSLKMRSTDRVNLNAINDLIKRLASKYLPHPDLVFPKIERRYVGDEGKEALSRTTFKELNELNILIHIFTRELGIKEEEAKVLSEQILRLKDSIVNEDNEGLLKVIDDISKATFWKKINIRDDYITLVSEDAVNVKGQTLESWFKRG
ncbi:MAG: DNA repair exonuclease [Thermosphaera sp.]